MSEALESTCDMCGGPLGQHRWRHFPPICTKCEMETIHATPDLSAPYLDAYNRLRDARSMLTDTFRYLEEEEEGITEGDPITDVLDQIEDLIQTFRDSVVQTVEEWAE